MSQVHFEKRGVVSTSRQTEETSNSIASVDCQPIGILVIEDHGLLRRTLANGLKEKGFTVWTASDGGEGVGLYARFGMQIDMVLSDVQMPIMDGPEMLAALRDINPAVRCCFMTGDTRPGAMSRLKSHSPFGLFIKPFDIADLIAFLRNAMNLPPEIEDGGAAHNQDIGRRSSAK